MDFSGYIDSIVSFAQSNTVVAIVLALFLLFLIYRKPKLFFTLLFLGLFLMGVFYMIMDMAGSGSQQKKRMIDEEEKESDGIHSSLLRNPLHFAVRDLRTHQTRPLG